MGFFNDFLNSLSGKAQQEQAEKALQAQLNLAQMQLQEELEEQKLKYSPEAQKAKMVGYIVIGIIIIVIGYFIIKKLV